MGLFKSSKKKVLEKANQLRLNANKASKEEEKVVDNWSKETRGKRGKDLEQINRKNQVKFNKAEKKERVAYGKYYDHLHKHFSNDELNSVVLKTHDFMSSKTLKELDKNTLKKSKKKK